MLPRRSFCVYLSRHACCFPVTKVSDCPFSVSRYFHPNTIVPEFFIHAVSEDLRGNKHSDHHQVQALGPQWNSVLCLS